MIGVTNLQNYFQRKRQMTPEQRTRSLEIQMSSFGLADQETPIYRQARRDAGYDVVLRNDISRQDVVASLQRIQVYLNK